MRQNMLKDRNLAENNTRLNNAKSIGSRNLKTNAHGITLIALVITIIVLLILAGVSISAITGNDSAMEKAQQAKNESEKGDELDFIKLAVVDAVAHGTTGYVTGPTLAEALTGSVLDATEDTTQLTQIRNNANGSWIIIGHTGSVYEINQNSNIEKLTGLVLIPRTLTLKIENDTYEETTITARLIDIEGTLTWSNSTDIIDITPAQDGKSALIKAKKNGTETIIVTCSNGDTATCSVTVTKEMPLAKNALKITNNVSPYVNYYAKDGSTTNKILCRVLYNDEVHGLQIISNDVVQGVNLGKNDSSINDNTDGLTISQKSYNNSIIKLNNIAKDWLNNSDNIALDARCVGSINRVSNNCFIDKDKALDSNGQNVIKYSGFTDANFIKYNNLCYDTDNNYTEDILKLQEIGSYNKTNTYYLASRYVYLDDNNSVRFTIRGVYNGSDYNPWLWIVNQRGQYQESESNLSIRPVFLIKPTVKISGGDGLTPQTAFALEAGD